MKFLADENIAKSLVFEIRLKNHDVIDLKENKLFGLSDKEVIALAKKENRILITHDKDFLDAFSFPKSAHSGIIILRLKNIQPKRVVEAFKPVFDEKIITKLENSLVVIDEEKIRFVY